MADEIVDGSVAEARAGLARRILAVRRCRDDAFAQFGRGLFGEPSWDILLDLFSSEVLGRRICVTSVGITAGIPTTTAQRHVALLERRGLLAREEDRADGRRTWVSLTAEGSSAVGGLLAKVAATMEARDPPDAGAIDPAAGLEAG